MEKKRFNLSRYLGFDLLSQKFLHTFAITCLTNIALNELNDTILNNFGYLIGGRYYLDLGKRYL